MKSVAFLTLGCKVNFYETGKMRDKFVEKGYAVKEFTEAADVYIINTCTVTNVADRKSRKMLHRARKLNQRALVVAAGCYVDSAKPEDLKDSLIDLWVSNKDKDRLVELVEEKISSLQNDLKEENMVKLPEEHSLAADTLQDIRHHTRAYIKVQDGCNQFCSYCIIPYVRGRIKSRPEDEILKEIKELAEKGIKEVVVTGIHLSSYGVDVLGEKDFTRFKGMPLLALIEKIAAIEGIERIRFGSIEPRVMTEEFVKGLAAIGKVCPHFHLSLQSGCDDTLKRMNRHYTTEEYMTGVELLRRYFDNPAITTDVIVGFPQESEEEFARTEEFLARVGFAQMHIFKYSRRAGTVADKMDGQIDEQIKNIRSEKLLALEKDLEAAYRQAFSGKKALVLWEEIEEIEGKTYMTGYTREYIRVAVPCPREKEEEWNNQIMEVSIQGRLNGEYMLAQFGFLY